MVYLCHPGSKAQTGRCPSHSGGFVSLDLSERIAWSKEGSKFESVASGLAKCGRALFSTKLPTLVTTTARSAPEAARSSCLHPNSDRISTGLALPWVTDNPVESVQAPPLPTAQPGLGAASRPNASKLWPFSPMGSEGWSPQPWSPDKSTAVLETKQVSPPSCQVPPSTLTLSQRRRADNGQQRGAPGSPASGRSPDQPRPSLLPLGSCKGVQHAPPNPGPGQSPGTADHPRPTNPIPPPRGSKDLRR